MRKKEHISGIVHKEFLKVRGDGKKTVRELLNRKSPRDSAIARNWKRAGPEKLALVIPAREKFLPFRLMATMPAGHYFSTTSASVNAALLNRMDEICSRIPAFYFGRLDIRYESRQLLEEGKSFSVLEVNGAGSEPTHIYDPRHSLFFAWKEIIRHWVAVV